MMDDDKTYGVGATKNIGPLSLSRLQLVSALRCEAGEMSAGKPVGGFARRIEEWSINDWLVALGGEVGEAMAMSAVLGGPPPTLSDRLVRIGAELGAAMNSAKKLFRQYDLTTGKEAFVLKQDVRDALSKVVDLVQALQADMSVIDCGTGSGGNQVNPHLLAAELADAQCYLPLVATRAAIDLETATKVKFNEVSERVKSSLRLP